MKKLFMLLLFFSVASASIETSLLISPVTDPIMVSQRNEDFFPTINQLFDTTTTDNCFLMNGVDCKTYSYGIGWFIYEEGIGSCYMTDIGAIPIISPNYFEQVCPASFGLENPPYALRNDGTPYDAVECAPLTGGAIDKSSCQECVPNNDFLAYGMVDPTNTYCGSKVGFCPDNPAPQGYSTFQILNDISILNNNYHRLLFTNSLSETESRLRDILERTVTLVFSSGTADYLPLAVNGWFVNFEKSSNGCKMNAGSVMLANCDPDASADIGRSILEYSYVFPARDDTLLVYLANDLPRVGELVSINGQVVGEVVSQNQFKYLELDCSLIDCNPNSVKELTFDFEFASIDFCYKPACTEEVGWSTTYSQVGDKPSTASVDCSVICDDPSACSQGYCLRTEGELSYCAQDINCGLNGWWGYVEDVVTIEDRVVDNICRYDFSCEAGGFAPGVETTKLLINDRSREYTCSDCITGLFNEEGLCACPEGSSFDLMTNRCVNPSEGALFQAANYVYGADWLVGADLCDPVTEALRSGDDLTCIPFFSCDETEYYDVDTGDCLPLESLSVDCSGEGFLYDSLNEQCVSEVECLDCDDGFTGVFGHCSVDDSLEGWVGSSQDCPQPGTFRDFGNYRICYYSPDNQPCNNNGCKVKEDKVVGEGWVCDPLEGAVLAVPELAASFETLELMPSLLAFGLQDKVKSVPQELEELVSCGCAAQTAAGNEPFCGGGVADYNPLTLPIDCSCLSNIELVRNKVWSDDYTSFQEFSLAERCERLGFVGDCFWKYDELITLPQTPYGFDLSEKNVWCGTAFNGDYCDFIANNKYLFDFEIASLIDALIYAYDKEHQFPIRMTSFSRGEELFFDDGSSEGVVRLGLTDSLSTDFFIESSVESLRSIGLDYASLNLFCYAGVNSENQVMINDELVGVVECGPVAGWQRLTFSLESLSQGVNTVSVIGNELNELLLGVDLGGDHEWLLNDEVCGLSNTSPSSSLISNDFNDFFVKGDDLFIVDDAGLHDFKQGVDFGLEDLVILDALESEGSYYVATSEGLYSGFGFNLFLIDERVYEGLFWLGDEVLFFDEGLGYQLQGESFIEIALNGVVQGPNNDLFLLTSEGVSLLTPDELVRVTSDSVVKAVATEVTGDGVSDLVLFNGEQVKLFYSYFGRFRNELLFDGSVSELVVSDLNFNELPEVYLDNVSPFSIDCGSPFSIDCDSPFSIDCGSPVNSLRLELSSFDDFNTSPVFISDGSWVGGLHSVFVDNGSVLSELLASEPVCPGVGGALMLRLNYGEESPVTVPDLLFPNINVDPSSVMVEGAPFGRVLYCGGVYDFNLSFVQDELIESSYEVFSFDVSLGGAPLYCDNAGVVEFPEGEGSVDVSLSCQFPYCHWGLPQFESFRVCVSAGEFSYENCYAFDSIQGLASDPVGLSGGNVNPGSVSVNQLFDLSADLSDSLGAYDFLSGAYLERDGVSFCVNNSLIPVVSDSLLLSDCFLSEPGVYEVHVAAGSYWDEVIGTLSVVSECSGAGDCVDGNPCTSDACIESLCVNAPLDGVVSGSYCANGLEVACLENSHCTQFYEQAGTCYYNPTCSDSNECEYISDVCGVDEVCEASGCVISCSPFDTNACYSSDVWYYDTSCNPSSKVEECDKGNECMNYDCSGASCTSSTRTGSCTDDGLACTSDICQGGSCTHTDTCSTGVCCGLSSNSCSVDPDKCCVYIESQDTWSC